MRFAYIDSHGNEVPIPSVDALALRIELGAVGPDTQLYDAQADHWAPARTHEIFHTLTRELGDEGFVAPPPVAPPPVAPPPQAPAAPPPQAPAAPPPAVAEPKKGKAKEKQKGKEADAAPDLGLTLAAPPPEPEEATDTADAAFGDLDLDLAPAASGGAEPGAPVTDEEGAFDFGDLDTGMDLEGEPPLAVEGAGGGYGGELELETPMEFTGGFAGGGDDLELEQPMSGFTADEPPGWAEGGDDEVMDFSAVSADEVAEDEALVPVAEAPARQRRASKDRPSPPKFKGQRSLSGPIVFVVILLALGVGGYVGWPILSARLSTPAAPTTPAVVMPEIPDELMPRMRSLAEAAIAAAVQEVDAGTATAGAPTEPPEQWLAGVYLGNASQFEAVETFWSGIGRFLDGLHAGEWQLYHDKFVALAAAEELPAETAALLTERADSGFVAAAGGRAAAYAAMERVVEASLDLHDFLVRNEAEIDYRPEATSAADPVLQAVPRTPELNSEMLDLVDEVTEALDSLGSLDRVTRERLTTAMRTRLQEVGIQ